jgi:rhodanese-related sulfurtransferase
MERREKILIIDARAGKSLLGSRVQIRGAFHFTLSDLEKGPVNLPRDREIIIYCT